MEEILGSMEKLIVQIRQSKEYNRYQNLLQTIKKQPELYTRIGEFRKDSLAMQMHSDNVIAANESLQEKYQDLKKNGLANDFFAAEHEYCNMVKKIQELFYEGVDIDTNFLMD